MKKGSIASVAVLTTVSLVISACAIRLPNTMAGSGNVVTESRPISDINAVTLAGAGELQIDQIGPTGSESLTIEADDNFLPLITTEVRNGRLTIGFREGVIPTRVSRVRYVLNVNALNGIDLSGAGTVNATNLAGDDLAITSSGAGTITTAGKVTNQRVNMSGAGSYEGANLDSETASVQLSGLGSAIVRVSKKLDANVSSVGSIEYIGSPTVNQQVSGAGSVKQRQP